MNYKKMTLEELEHEMCKQLKEENKELRKRIDELCEQSKWTKLDKNNPKTFPQRDEEEVLLYVTFDNGEKCIIQATVIWTSNREFYFSDFNGDEVHDNVYDITYWMPLPKPPTELS